MEELMLPALHIAPEILSRWPQSRLGCLVHEVQVEESRADAQNYLSEILAPMLQRLLQDTPLASIPNLSESRAAYKAFGRDPGRYRISSEALYRRIRQGKALYRINSVVDANNLASLETGFSVGSYDLSQVGSDILLRLGQAGEVYRGIGKEDLPLENLPLLCDAQGPFGGATSDSTRAMIRPETTTCLTVIYGFSSLDALDRAMQTTARLFADFTQSRPLTAPFVVPPSPAA